MTAGAAQARRFFDSAAADPPDTLRRVLTEGRDDVLRALRCRARDAQAAGR